MFRGQVLWLSSLDQLLSMRFAFNRRSESFCLEGLFFGLAPLRKLKQCVCSSISFLLIMVDLKIVSK